MFESTVYGEIPIWKRPLHSTKARLAKNYLKLLPSVKIIGITGSVGKTLTQNAIASVLSQKYKVAVGDENLDPTFRIPQTILRAKVWDKFIILEYGIEAPNQMDYYLSIAKPNIAIITQIAPTHTKHLKDVQGVQKEKAKIIEGLKYSDIAILNADDPNSIPLVKRTKATIVWFGQNAKAKEVVKISHFTQTVEGSTFRMHYMGQQEKVHWNILGKHQLTSAYIAATVGIINKMTLKQIAKGLQLTIAPQNRMNLITSEKYTIINDSYNSSPIAAKEAINTLLAIAKNKKKVLVLGEMKDLGKLSKKEHIDLGLLIAKTNINYLFTIGTRANLIAKTAELAYFNGKIITSQDTNALLLKIKKIVPKKSFILVKGSRHTHLERVVLGLTNKPTNISCYHCGKLN